MITIEEMTAAARLYTAIIAVWVLFSLFLFSLEWRKHVDRAGRFVKYKVLRQSSGGAR